MANNNAKIRFVSGEYAGAEIELTPFNDVTLGRNPEMANFVFNSEGVSRRHCIIQYNPNDRRFRVTDLSSSGTIINNVKKMERGNVEYLSAGDTLKIGHSDNVIQLIAPPRLDNTGVRVAPGLTGGNGDSGGMGETGVLGPQGRVTVKMNPGIGMSSGNQTYPVYTNQGGGYPNMGNPQQTPWGSNNLKSGESQSDVVGIIGAALSAVAVLIAIIILIYAANFKLEVLGYSVGTGFKLGCAYFISTKLMLWILWVILTIAGTVLGIVFLIQISGKAGRPTWMGILAIVGGVLALIAALIVLFSSFSAAADLINMMSW